MGGRGVHPHIEVWGGHMEDPVVVICPAMSGPERRKLTTFEPLNQVPEQGVLPVLLQQGVRQVPRGGQEVGGARQEGLPQGPHARRRQVLRQAGRRTQEVGNVRLRKCLSQEVPKIFLVACGLIWLKFYEVNRQWHG